MWDGGRRAALVSSLREISRRDLLAQREALPDDLDVLARAWVDARRESCEQARALGRERYAAVGACHEEVRALLDGVVTTLLDRSSPAVLDRAHLGLVAAHDLLARCQDAGEPLAPATAGALARARAAQLLGEPVLAWQHLSAIPRAAAITAALAAGTDREARDHLSSSPGEDRRLAAALAALEAARALEEGDRPRARARAGRAISLAPGTAAAERAAGVLARVAEDPEALAAAADDQRSPLERARLLLAAGELTFARGDFARASDLYKRAGDLLAPLAPASAPLLAAALLGQGRALIHRGALEEAEALLTRALHLRQQSRGRWHLETAESLHHLGALYELRGRLELAELQYREALQIRFTALGDDPETARSYNNLGRLAYRRRDLASARDHHAHALEIRVTELGPRHPDTATSLNNLGAVYWAIGDEARARALFEQALEIRRAALPPDHPHVAVSLNNLGELELAAGDFVTARALHEQALALRREVLGDGHLETARSRLNLGRALLALGERAAARRELDMALETFTRQLGADHPETLRARELLDASLEPLAPEPDSAASDERR
ncbi:MAG: tetratricopeptide repeat protein [Nannocystaceae bacterium]